MTVETSIDALTTQTSALLDVCTALKAGVAQQIADAVVVSQNAAVTPLLSVATNLIRTQAMLVTYISNR